MSGVDTSRIPGFYRLSLAERRALVRERAGLSDGDLDLLTSGGLDLATAEVMIENVVGTYALPFGVALNFCVNDQDVLVPMVVEEPSVVAAASNAARMVRPTGGFRAEVDPPVMIGQVHLCGVGDPEAARHRIREHRAEILAEIALAVPGLCERGGGPREVSVRILSLPADPDGGILVVHLEVDCRDAMGANMVNTAAEAVSDRLARLCGPGARAALRILTNLADLRRVRVRARVSAGALTGPGGADGQEVVDAIARASRLAELDPYRAATHNKGIMNGIDAVLVATGNDWRGVEAGAHAFAARGGRYAPLATWRRDGEDLVGVLELPMAVGIVGGALRAHRGARLAIRLLHATTADELACVVGAAGLASNLAALRALATDGIQRGHMRLAARAAASGEAG